MKKSFLIMAAFASMLAFTACSSDDDVLADNNENIENTDKLGADEDYIDIAISNTGEETRAARPMGSSAAGNNVDKIQLEFYLKDLNGDFNRIDYADNFDFEIVSSDNENTTDVSVSKDVKGLISFKNNSKENSTNATGENIANSIKIKVKGLEAKQTYRIVAYGYNSEEPYTITKATETNKFKELIAKNKGVVTSSNAYTNVEEMFAASVERETNENNKFKTAPRLTLTRQVAGMLAYFKVPAFIFDRKVHYVKVYASKTIDGFNMSINEDLNGTWKSDAEEELMVFDMKNAASNFDGVNNFTDYYKTNNSNKGYAEGYTAPTNFKKLEDTFFGARYILPYNKHYEGQTLCVKLIGEDGKTVLKTVNVITNNIPSGGTKNAYDIRKNNFYSIGKKLTTDGTEGPGTDPDTDPDKPIDLGASDQILVEINDAWSVLHNMDIEE